MTRAGASSAIRPCVFADREGLQPLPEPVAGGSIADLATFVNVNSEEDLRCA